MISGNVIPRIRRATRVRFTGYLTAVVGLLVGVVASAASPTLTSFQPVSLPMIQAGTAFPVDNYASAPPANYSHLISFVRGQLTRGDISAVTDTVRYYAEIFNLVMLADARPDNQGTHYLREVAIGFSMHIGDRNVVVTSDTQGQLGGDLSIIGRSVLSGNYDALSDLKQVARTPQTMLIDAPALMLRGGKHVKMIVRYFVWVDPGSGRIGTLAWLLDTAGRFEGQSPTLQVLPPMMMEDRVMHVDGEQFNFLGIPSPTAFALVQMPQGQAFPVTEAMRPLAGKPTYDPESYAKLVNAITAALSS